MWCLAHINFGVCMMAISPGPGRFTIIGVTIGVDHDCINVTIVQVSKCNYVPVTAGHNTAQMVNGCGSTHHTGACAAL